MLCRNVVRLRSGLSYAGIIEKESSLLEQSVDFSLCIIPNDKVAIKILIPQNEIESIFHSGVKYEDNDILNYLCESEE